MSIVSQRGVVGGWVGGWVGGLGWEGLVMHTLREEIFSRTITVIE